MTVRTGVPVTDDAPAPRAERIGRGLMVFAAIATLVAFVDGVMKTPGMPDDRLMSEGWRTFAYLVFAGLLALLAAEPRRHRGVWELVLLQKIAVTVFAFMISHVPEALTTGLIDLALVVTVGVAYVLCRGWYAWRPAAPEPAGHRRPVPAAG
ncbi:hypothetical protein [Sphaerisporangium sp. TRM90804]|uniref:hypothetical protein n=1 Tax=Sphaerisporangium sp. TRM90804 TaxID=3031113 RepID=UPI00244BBEAF|nr:hypothetical protein [Sphaerisporangium sp. TRM90804]MDH2425909.1 hypothetical protein [Sphaerisporangium sp. TRM90804]